MFLSIFDFRKQKFMIQIFIHKFTSINLLLRQFTSNYRAGKKHFGTLIYPILPKIIINYHILRKTFSNSHPCHYKVFKY